MNYKFVIKAICGYCLLLLCFPCIAANGLLATSMSPQSNYAPSFGIDDLQQLTDGIARQTDGTAIPYYSLRTRAESVGWQNYKQVEINLALSDISSTGQLKVHVERTDEAKVYVPLRMDLYGSHDGITYYHLSGQFYSHDNYQDRELHWLEMPTAEAHSQLVLIISANGTYIQLDEISWLNTATTAQTPQQVSIDGMSGRSQLQHDSLARLGGYCAAGQDFLVTAIDPDPNYPSANNIPNEPTSNFSADKDQLTNCVLVRPSIWGREGGVAWKDSTRIVIDATLDNG